MSSYYGGGFDEWVEDSFFCPITPDQLSRIKALLESYRESIDNKLSVDFEPDTMSWRTYRNDLWLYIPKDLNDKIDEIVRETNPPDDSSATS
jgi:hypothetical protein